MQPWDRKFAAPSYLNKMGSEARIDVPLSSRRALLSRHRAGANIVSRVLLEFELDQVE
jgi:hypothetical protein